MGTRVLGSDLSGLQEVTDSDLCTCLTKQEEKESEDEESEEPDSTTGTSPR